jgi:hypothetical protein
VLYVAKDRRASGAALPLDVKARAFIMVQRFGRFDAENDPYDEHDFRLRARRRDVFLEDRLLRSRRGVRVGRDPSDPEKTTRVLTIILAHEY